MKKISAFLEEQKIFEEFLFSFSDCRRGKICAFSPSQREKLVTHARKKGPEMRSKSRKKELFTAIPISLFLFFFRLEKDLHQLTVAPSFLHECNFFLQLRRGFFTFLSLFNGEWEEMPEDKRRFMPLTGKRK